MNAKINKEYIEDTTEKVLPFPVTKNKVSLIPQKICGVVFILSAVTVAALTGGDITVAFLFVPLGLYALFTKENIIWRG